MKKFTANLLWIAPLLLLVFLRAASTGAVHRFRMITIRILLAIDIRIAQHITKYNNCECHAQH